MAQYERNSTSEITGLPGAPGPAAGIAVAQNAANSMMRGNMELMSFISRRAKAQMELAKSASACRNPADFGQLGAQFWRETFHDYLDFNHRVMGMWTQSMAAIGQGDLARQTADIANRTVEPMVEAAEAASARMTEHPTEPWAWWRTDVAGVKTGTNGNGHTSDKGGGARVGY